MELAQRLELLLQIESRKNIFGERLEYLRKRAGWSRAEVAHRIDLSQSTITKHEYGDREPNLTTLRAYAMLYDVSIDYLLGLSDDPDVKASTIAFGWREAQPESELNAKDWLSEQDIADLRELLRKMRKSGVYSANW